jgi:hypothetical protein
VNIDRAININSDLACKRGSMALLNDASTLEPKKLVILSKPASLITTTTIASIFDVRKGGYAKVSPTVAYSTASIRLKSVIVGALLPFFKTNRWREETRAGMLANLASSCLSASPRVSRKLRVTPGGKAQTGSLNAL